MTDKILTVSVAAYNVEAYLAEALDSCVVPNRNLLEVIVVDDGSKDETSAVAQRFVDLYPETFKLITKQNGGYGSTINASLKEAQGLYYRYLDGDDWFEKKGLEEYLGLLREETADVVYTPYCRVHEGDGKREVCIDVKAGEGRYDLSEMTVESPLAACSLAYKTEFLKKLNFEMTEHCFYTDVEYGCIPFAFAQTVFVSNTVLYCYRIGREGQSVSIASVRNHYRDIVIVNQRLIRALMPDARLDVRIIPSEYIRTVLVKEVITAYYYLFLAGPSVQAKKELVDFDMFIKGYWEIYTQSACSAKSVDILRRTHFALYSVLCRRAAKQTR